jgi:hypothetical protein
MAACVVASLVLAGPAAAQTAGSLGPLEFFQGASPAIVAPSLTSLQQEVTNASGAGVGGGAGRVKTSSIRIVKPIDSASPKLFQATAQGTHFSKVTIEANTGGTTITYCLGDAFITSESTSLNADGRGEEELAIVAAKESRAYGTDCSSSSDSGPVVTTLIGLGKGAASVIARVDCLEEHCGGRLVVGLPGGATTGGGKFSMGDGSVRLLKLPVPADARPGLRGLGDGALKTVVTLAGHKAPIVGHGQIGAPPKKIPGLPNLTVAPAPTPIPTPVPTPTPTPTPPAAPIAQTVAITGCRTPVPGAAFHFAITGSLSPARAGVPVTLEFTAVGGDPQPLPGPIVQTATTDAAGNFATEFDRSQKGADYSWTVTASVAEGGGYLAATSSSCALPVP